MLIHSAKTRNTSQIAAAKRQSPTSSHSSQKLKTCDATANAGWATRRNTHESKISSVARLVFVLYGSRQSQSVRSQPSDASLFGSPGWSENAWWSRCRFTQVTG